MSLNQIVTISFICLFSFTNINKPCIVYRPIQVTDTIPAFVKGNFMDDYGIRYNITDSLWTQKPGIKYHIIKWNIKEQYLIAKNDDKNPSEAGLYSRIDYMPLKNIQPFGWGFCLTVYNAKTDSIAEFSTKADRENPKKGCGGFPFSRMKRI